MYKVTDFVRWALSHAKGHTQPWHYLYGSVRVQTTKDTLDRYYANYYNTQMTRERYDQLTADWLPTDYATDCQGLLDAYLTYEQGDKTDINADMNYVYWCTDKGKVSEIDRPYVIGEAVFMGNSSGRMTHIGWVCGFEGDEPLVVEARGIAYGVVVTRFSERKWQYRGLMTKKFDYTEEPEMIVVFEVTKPMHTGEPYKAMQTALNLAGYTDADDRALDEDGKWGKRSQQAFDKLIGDYAAGVIPPVPEPEPIVAWKDENGRRIVLEYK